MKIIHYDIQTANVLNIIVQEVESLFFREFDYLKKDIFLLSGEGGIQMLWKYLLDEPDDRYVIVGSIIDHGKHPDKYKFSIGHCPQFDNTRYCGERHKNTYFPLTSYMYDVYVGGSYQFRLKPEYVGISV